MDIPPLFKQGASARVRAGFFALIAIVMLVVDSRMHALTVVRQAVGTVLYPFQVVALMPRDAAYKVGDYFTSLNTVQSQNDALRRQQVLNAQLLQQERQISAENNQLRNLLNMQQRVPSKSLVGEILYDARDPFTRKIILNRGSQQGVTAGQPVIDDIGIVGQVTRVFPFTSEVTLLTDKDQAIPVQVLRNGLRSVAYGRGQSGLLDLRFMASNADIRKGDALVTSGIDGVYPAGLSVATVVQVETKSTDAFAHIVCMPSAGIDRHRQLLILLVGQSQAQRPGADVPADKDDKLLKRRLRESSKEQADERSKTPPAEERKGAASTSQAAVPEAAASAPAATTPVARAASAPVVAAQPVKSTK
jgi:rod shape-determining protein MreC